MSTGENEQAMRKILDMTRLIALIILAIHFYFYCYAAFHLWQLSTSFTDGLLGNIRDTGLFSTFYKSKLLALLFLAISLLGAKGKKDDKLVFKTAFAYLFTGLILFFISYLFLFIGKDIQVAAILYISVTALGFLLVLTGGTLLSRIIMDRLKGDIFNKENETFPQEERLLVNENSINLPMRYQLKNKWRNGYLNVLAPYRSTLVTGSAGAGKTAFIIREFIIQALAKEKPYSMLIYDFKFPDLSKIAYNHFLKNKHRYQGEPECLFINFDDPSRSNRGNPLEPENMIDITDATESARTILLGLNKQWQTKQGDFFIESPINFFTAIIWYLRCYQNGQFCTLPHAIELLMLDYDTLFSILQTEPQVTSLMNPFINAYLNDAMEQLEGQIASAKIALGRLSSPKLYYVLTGNDFTLDINNPKKPKVLCLGSNPQKTQIYGAVLSLFANRLLKIINKKDQDKSMLIFEEYPTISVDLIPTISTGRSNRIAVVMVVQSINQLKKEYGREQADVITSIAGNLIAGQETGDGAKQLSEQIGKIMQDRESISISNSGTSITKSKQLDYAVPASKIAKLSSGQFGGILSDVPDQPMELKAFDCEVKADFDAINKEEAAYKDIPIIRQVNDMMIQRNYLQVKEDIQFIKDTEMDRIIHDPDLQHLAIKKGG
ncbi:conjugal transfer protein MobC [Pedobacter sp. MC2016-24]|uniref:conjugal transfer protein MobC n=1 Tax=Pedobacter sp. MC2016-24 TaxID=2780090 RepID=UPI00187F8BCE|nr:conjugal transfer protein MobC [Pedobacter sp. MC2016-24]MBE9598702.1 YWFCY domain-containing protein [Pedobacter sp. MC2016-24]